MQTTLTRRGALGALAGTADAGILPAYRDMALCTDRGVVAPTLKANIAGALADA